MITLFQVKNNLERIAKYLGFGHSDKKRGGNFLETFR